METMDEYGIKLVVITAGHPKSGTLTYLLLQTDKGVNRRLAVARVTLAYNNLIYSMTGIKPLEDMLRWKRPQGITDKQIKRTVKGAKEHTAARVNHW